MPGKGMYTQYEPTLQNMGLGKSSVTLLDDMFKSNKDVYLPANLIPRANQYLLAYSGESRTKQQGDINQFPGGVDMSYAAAPNFKENASDIVHSGGEGWPSTQYTPNIKSPGERADGVHVSVSEITPMSSEALAQFKVTSKIGMNGILNPNQESVRLGNSVGIGKELIPGKAPGR